MARSRGGSRPDSGQRKMNLRHGTPGNNSMARGVQPLTSFFVGGNNQDAEDSNNVGNNAGNEAREQNDNPLQEDATQDACPTEHNRNLPNTQQREQSEPNLQNPDMSSARKNGRSVSGIVKAQLDSVTKKNKNHGNSVRKSVEEGKLWERRGAILHNHILPNKMKNGWQCFFQMDVYTWIPSILLERNKTP